MKAEEGSAPARALTSRAASLRLSPATSSRRTSRSSRSPPSAVAKPSAIALGSPEGTEYRHPLHTRRARDVAQQHQARSVGPVQVIEHEHDRRPGRHVAQQLDHRLEQAVAFGL